MYTRRTRVPPTARDALIAIAALLAPDEPDVADQVAHASHDPNGYLQAYADRLDERGIDEPIPNLAWIALIDALTDRGLLAEMDWKESAEEIIAQLRGLRSSPPQPEAWAWMDHTDTDRPTHDFLELAGNTLRSAGTALAVLDIQSDCYPLVLLPADRANELIDLATTAGFTAHVLAVPQE
jgi:hypothetical protein